MHYYFFLNMFLRIIEIHRHIIISKLVILYFYLNTIISMKVCVSHFENNIFLLLF